MSDVQQSSENLHAQEIWDEGYSDLKFEITPTNDFVRSWIERSLKKYVLGSNSIGSSLSCLEIGCFPGRYLAVFGEMGFKLNGLDLTPRVDEMSKWLADQGYATGEFSREDFFTFSPREKYDVVYSLGFIEHFNDFQSVIVRHADLVKPGGLLVLNTPNFAGPLQRLLHKLTDRENLDRHYLPSMNPILWEEPLKKIGFEILESGYYGDFYFWNGDQKRNLAQKAGLAAIRLVSPILSRILPANARAFAPYCGLVARKTP